MRLLPCTTVAVIGLLIGTTTSAADIYNGKEIYGLHCETCHGTDGRSVEPGTPDFSSGESLFVADSHLMRVLRDGIGSMPAYRGLLSDAEILDVIAYVRTLQR